MRPLVLAIDLDGVIHDPNNRNPGYKMGVPITDAQAAVSALYKAGHRIIIHTVWGGDPQMRQAIHDWLMYFHIPYHEITNIKPRADYYIDDRAMRFTSWDDALKQLEEVTNGTSQEENN